MSLSRSTDACGGWNIFEKYIDIDIDMYIFVHLYIVRVGPCKNLVAVDGGLRK